MTPPRRAEAPPSGIPSWACVGAKVVCIRDDWSYEYIESLGFVAPNRVPMLNEILTVRQVTGPDARIWTDTVLYFDETGLFGYAARCFRPLITKSQSEDIAEFRKLLTGQPVRESERA